MRARVSGLIIQPDSLSLRNGWIGVDVAEHATTDPATRRPPGHRFRPRWLVCAPINPSTRQACRGCDRNGTLIRHCGSGGLPTESIFPLPVAVIQPAFLAALVPPIGAAPLPIARLSAAVLAAIAVA